MFAGLDQRLPSFGRRVNGWLTSRGGVIVLNPLIYRSTPVTVLMVASAALKTVCKMPPGSWSINLLQDSVGGWQLSSLPADWRVIGGIPTLTATPGAIDVLTVDSDGVNTIAVVTLGA